MAQAKIKPGQNKIPIDIKATKEVDKKGSKGDVGFELPSKSTHPKSKESRNNQ